MSTNVLDTLSGFNNHDSCSKVEEETAHLINKLFVRLCALFPAFKQSWPDQEIYNCDKRIWTAAFIQSKLNNWNDIEKGIVKFSVLKNPFIPTAGQFIEMCKPNQKDLGLLSVEQAYKKAYECANNKKWDCSVIFHAWQESDPHFMKTYTRDKTYAIFKRNYEIACDMFMNGEELTSIPLAIEDHSQQDDSWKTLRKYGGILPQYAHIDSYEEAMPIIQELIKKNGGHIIKKINRSLLLLNF